jgi:hypothetical protein
LVVIVKRHLLLPVDECLPFMGIERLRVATAGYAEGREAFSAAADRCDFTLVNTYDWSRPRLYTDRPAHDRASRS